MFSIAVTYKNYLFGIKQSCDSNEAGTLLTIYESSSFSEGRGTDHGSWPRGLVCKLRISQGGPGSIKFLFSNGTVYRFLDARISI